MPFAQSKIIIAPGVIKPMNSDTIPKGPMTSKQAKKSYKERNCGPKMTRAEQKKIEKEELEKQRKEFEREKRLERERIKREKKKEKEQEERMERRKNKVPEKSKWVRPSQGRITGFVVLEKRSRETSEDKTPDIEDPATNHPSSSYDGANDDDDSDSHRKRIKTGTTQQQPIARKRAFSPAARQEQLATNPPHNKPTIDPKQRQQKGATVVASKALVPQFIQPKQVPTASPNQKTSPKMNTEDKKEDSIEADTIDKSLVPLYAVSGPGNLPDEPLPPAPPPPKSSIDYFAQLDAEDDNEFEEGFYVMGPVEQAELRQIREQFEPSGRHPWDDEPVESCIFCSSIICADQKLYCNVCECVAHTECADRQVEDDSDCNVGAWTCEVCLCKAYVPLKCYHCTKEMNYYQKDEFLKCSGDDDCKTFVHERCADSHRYEYSRERQWYCRNHDKDNEAHVGVYYYRDNGEPPLHCGWCRRSPAENPNSKELVYCRGEGCYEARHCQQRARDFRAGWAIEKGGFSRSQASPNVKKENAGAMVASIEFSAKAPQRALTLIKESPQTKPSAVPPTASPDYFAELDGLGSSYENAPVTLVTPTSIIRSLQPPTTPKSILKQPPQPQPTDRPALKELTPSASNARRVSFSPATRSVSVDDRNVANAGKKFMPPPETPSKVAPEILSYLEQYADNFPTSSQLARELMEDDTRTHPVQTDMIAAERKPTQRPKALEMLAPNHESLELPETLSATHKRSSEFVQPPPAPQNANSSAPSSKKRRRFFQERPTDVERAVLYESQFQAKKDDEIRSLLAESDQKLFQLLENPASDSPAVMLEMKMQANPGRRVEALKSQAKENKDEYDFGSDEIGEDDLADVTMDDILSGCT